MSSAKCFDKAERLAALRVAAASLQARYPMTQCNVIVDQYVNRLDAHAAWCWPGVVRVTMRYTGQLIAQSLPGKPYSLDSKAAR